MKGIEMGSLDGKVALISGGSRGQGEAEARLFAREGAAVVIGDVLDEEGERVAASITDSGGEASYVHLDVSDEEGWREAVEAAVSAHGRLTSVINNAGVLSQGEIEGIELAEFRRVIEINLIGVFLGMKAAIPALKAGGGGSIVNTSSTAGLEGYAGAGSYVASKWGVRGLTKVAALELGPFGIRVNSVHPGPIDTPMINPGGEPMGDRMSKVVPLGRVGLASEVAELMRFLVSDESSYCSGGEFKVDGGLSAGRRIF